MGTSINNIKKNQHIYAALLKVTHTSCQDVLTVQQYIDTPIVTVPFE